MRCSHVLLTIVTRGEHPAGTRGIIEVTRISVRKRKANISHFLIANVYKKNLYTKGNDSRFYRK